MKDPRDYSDEACPRKCILERFPITWNYVIEKESLNINKLEHVLVAKPLRTPDRVRGRLLAGHALVNHAAWRTGRTFSLACPNSLLQINDPFIRYLSNFLASQRVFRLIIEFGLLPLEKYVPRRQHRGFFCHECKLRARNQYT